MAESEEDSIKKTILYLGAILSTLGWIVTGVLASLWSSAGYFALFGWIVEEFDLPLIFTAVFWDVVFIVCVAIFIYTVKSSKKTPSRTIEIGNRSIEWWMIIPIIWALIWMFLFFISFSAILYGLRVLRMRSY
ncbi:MAG: hypothetical protein ACFFGZ_08085 [Candidatus Thorarchaeota archaeon]